MDQTSPKSPSPPQTPLLFRPLVPTAVTPTPLIIPKVFKYPEMYTSPTDLIMSPVSKGILARTTSKKSSLPLLNSSTTNKEQHKMEASMFGERDALGI
ncbi:unnamed protein product [Lactuca virosa]|uniref:Uncharacterized protein n=1 Tax=Lactuca virosa TaxID=75947 RepID=A0AAU9M2Q3_9ASTR|nr:unnamed protein product [Lactuca virosa]